MPIRIKRGQALPLLLTPAERDAVVKEVMPPTLEDKLQLGLAKDGEVVFLVEVVPVKPSGGHGRRRSRV
jgi:hypothetical protein